MCIFIILIIPDVIFDSLFELIHFILELLLEFAHILFEWIESALDGVVEHLFHTDLHDTQIIVFYIMMSVVGYGVYRLTRVLPAYYQQLQAKLNFFWLYQKTRATLFWQALPVAERIKWLVVGTLTVCSYLYFNL